MSRYLAEPWQTERSETEQLDTGYAKTKHEFSRLLAAVYAPSFLRYNECVHNPIPRSKEIAVSDRIAIIPVPATLVENPGKFVLNANTILDADASSRETAEILATSLGPPTGYDLRIQPDGRAQNVLRLRIADDLTHLGNEGYVLNVRPSDIDLRAPTPTGLFYACQTLLQLLPPAIFAGGLEQGVDVAAGWSIPCAHIEDQPRFGWRGAMLDVGRHFMPKEFVLRFIDLLALHKMNRFHWHLTDDQGWRIEIKRYPRLTTHGSMRSYTLVGHYADWPHRFDDVPHGGFYTQDEIREVVAYAQARHVTIVPEIDMPGHMDAAISAYPALGNLPMLIQPRCIWGISQHILNPQQSTIEFMQCVLEEVMDLFPGDFIHVGGDEALKREWEESRAVQERMAELGLASVDEMQSWFIRQMDAFITKKGRRLIGWDEILEGGLAPGASVMSWRGMAGGIAAARAHHDVVMAPTTWTYFDYCQGDPATEPLNIGNSIRLSKAYAFEPIPVELTAEEANHIMGGQCQLWTEYLPTNREVEYMAFPRLCATAEAVWSQKQRRSYDDFVQRLHTHVQRLDGLDVHYRPLD
jgi:hexosaminidase